ncbi:hypothetical protein PGT21_014418 [Puccinia graminis f. sp. tritici]|nr:hypothetical protein PGT21_013113 [Puccinia graminis f. sp. tritici]KAA1116456.1 hypothetical protein PGT21_014418 [Puccinia graminis f. sp. tritici]KAA1124781.1 hypothetical protein PGTUg99_034507 [Puccinia graminis f. sp. tritici]
MLGPERAVDAGPSSWTFVALEEAEEISDPSTVPDPSLSALAVLASPQISLDATTDLVVRKRHRPDNDPSSDLTGIPKRPWIIFESVGALDTHC